MVAALDPRANLVVFMGAVVVDDQMQAQTVWSFRVDHLEEGQPFLSLSKIIDLSIEK